MIGTERDLEAHTVPEMASATDDDELTLFSNSSYDVKPSSIEPKGPWTIMNLPNELQLMIVRELEFPDIVHLRRTCSYFRAFASPAVIRSLYGSDEAYKATLVSHCRECLTFRHSLERLGTSPKDPGYPLSSRCVPCVLQSRDGTIRVGKRIVLGDQLDCWVCRWCGWPIAYDDHADGHVQFHQRCRDKYGTATAWYVALGFVQLTIGVTASALSWRYFRHEMLIFAPATVSVFVWIPSVYGPSNLAIQANFILMWICIGIISFRATHTRTYHWALGFETAVAGLWVRHLLEAPE